MNDEFLEEKKGNEKNQIGDHTPQLGLEMSAPILEHGASSGAQHGWPLATVNLDRAISLHQSGLIN